MMVNRTMSKAFGLAGFRLRVPALRRRAGKLLQPRQDPLECEPDHAGSRPGWAEDEQDQDRQAPEHPQRAGSYIYDEINSMPGCKAFPRRVTLC